MDHRLFKGISWLSKLRLCIHILEILWDTGRSAGKVDIIPNRTRGVPGPGDTGDLCWIQSLLYDIAVALALCRLLSHSLLISQTSELQRVPLTIPYPAMLRYK
jgi:hypothetical protein